MRGSGFVLCVLRGQEAKVGQHFSQHLGKGEQARGAETWPPTGNARCDNKFVIFTHEIFSLPKDTLTRLDIPAAYD